MQTFFSTLVSKLGGQTPNLTGLGMAGIIITMVIALLYSFFGYRFLKFFVAFIGFLAGLGIGYLIGVRVGANTAVTWILAFVFAIALGVVSFFIYKAGVFIVTFFAVLAMVFQLAEKLPAPWPPVIAFIAGLAAAILAVVFLRPVFIITSGLCGAMAFSQTLLTDMLKWQNDYSSVVIFVLGLAVGILAILFQFRTTKGKKYGK
jgi:hypothetical protein